jgi:hypothetical protein
MAAIGQDRCVERIEKAIGILRSAAQSSAE